MNTIRYDKIAPNENVTWFHIRKSYSNDLEILEYSLKKVDGEIVSAILPENLNRLIRSGESLDKLLAEHSVYPAIQITSNGSLKLNVFKLSMAMINRSDFLKLASKQLHWASLKYCPKCFLKQIKDHGFNWILRDWSLPLVNTCAFHKAKLVTYQCECNLQQLSVKELLVNLFSGNCRKCSCSVWPETLKKASVKQHNICTWMTAFVNLEPIYISNAVHRTLLAEIKKSVGLECRKDDEFAYAILRHYFPRYGNRGKQFLLLEIKKWIRSIFPINTEVFFSVLIQHFSTVDDFLNFINASGQRVYLDNYELNKKDNFYENYDFFEGLSVLDENPDSYGTGRYLKVIV